MGLSGNNLIINQGASVLDLHLRHHGEKSINTNFPNTLQCGFQFGGYCSFLLFYHPIKCFLFLRRIEGHCPLQNLALRSEGPTFLTGLLCMSSWQQLVAGHCLSLTEDLVRLWGFLSQLFHPDSRFWSTIFVHLLKVHRKMLPVATGAFSDWGSCRF